MYVVETGFHLPQDKLTNAQLEDMVATEDAWILSHTGIAERRIASKDVDTSDLGAQATRNALERAGWEPESLELLVCATSTPDRLIPATASLIGMKLGIDPVAFDVNAACSGFVYGLAVARALALAHGYRRVALTTAEKYSRVTDYTDRGTCIFFGDSAGSVLLQPDEPAVGFEIVDVSMANVNEGAELVTTPVGGTFWQDGRKVKDYALRCFQESAERMLGRHELAVGDLRAFIGHQANLRVLELVANALGVAPEQHWFNVDRCGNQGAAGVATTFCEAHERRSGELRHGDWFLMTVFGSGFTTGSALLRRVDSR